jgi:hypothetical protein
MVESIGGTSNLVSMISLSYQQSGMGSQGTQGVGAPPPQQVISAYEEQSGEDSYKTILYPYP